MESGSDLKPKKRQSSIKTMTKSVQNNEILAPVRQIARLQDLEIRLQREITRLRNVMVNVQKKINMNKQD